MTGQHSNVIPLLIQSLDFALKQTTRFAIHAANIKKRNNEMLRLGWEIRTGSKKNVKRRKTSRDCLEKIKVVNVQVQCSLPIVQSSVLSALFPLMTSWPCIVLILLYQCTLWVERFYKKSLRHHSSQGFLSPFEDFSSPSQGFLSPFFQLLPRSAFCSRKTPHISPRLFSPRAQHSPAHSAWPAERTRSPTPTPPARQAES